MTTELPLEAISPPAWYQRKQDPRLRRFRAPLSIEQALELSLPDKRLQRLFTDYCQRQKAERVYAHILVDSELVSGGWERFGVVEGLAVKPDAYLWEPPDMFVALDKERCRTYLQRKWEEIRQSLRREYNLD